MAHKLDIASFYVIEAMASDFLAIGFGGSDNMTTGVINSGIFAGFNYIDIEGGQYLVCDDCNNDIDEGETCYYIAVLNRVFCKKCFYEWLSNATYYPEDSKIQLRNYARIQKNLLDKGVWSPDEISDFKS